MEPLCWNIRIKYYGLYLHLQMPAGHPCMTHELTERTAHGLHTACLELLLSYVVVHTMEKIANLYFQSYDLLITPRCASISRVTGVVSCVCVCARAISFFCHHVHLDPKI